MIWRRRLVSGDGKQGLVGECFHFFSPPSPLLLPRPLFSRQILPGDHTAWHRPSFLPGTRQPGSDTDQVSEKKEVKRQDVHPRYVWTDFSSEINMSKLAPSNITITCWPPYKLVSTPANIPLVHNVTSNSKSEIGHLQPWTKRNPDQWHISGAEHEWHGEGGDSEEASNDSHLPLLSLWGDSRGEGKGAPICLSEKHFLPRVESTSARSRRCFTRRDVASPGLKSTTRAMAANKTWFEIVLFKYSQS